MAQLRQRTKNTLHLAAVILHDRKNQVIGRVIVAALEPLRLYMLRAVEAGKTPAGAAYWAAEHCSGWVRTLHDVSSLLENHKVLASLTLSWYNPHRAPGAADRCLWESDIHYAEVLVGLATAVMAQRAWSMAAECCILPNAFAALLHPKLPEAVAAAKSLKGLWGAIVAHETSDEAIVQELFRDIGCHRMQLAREIAGMAEDCGWDPRDKNLRLVLWRAFATVNQTKNCLEDVFRSVNEAQRAQVRGGRWHRQMQVVLAGIDRLKPQAIDVEPEDWLVPLTGRGHVTEAAFLPPPFEKGHLAGSELDVKPLLKAKEKEKPKGESLEHNWRKAGVQANHRSAAALELLRYASAGRLVEACTQAWWLSLLGVGLVLTTSRHGYVLSLGSRRWAAAA
jgi:hypothetical protein